MCSLIADGVKDSPKEEIESFNQSDTDRSVRYVGEFDDRKLARRLLIAQLRRAIKAVQAGIVYEPMTVGFVARSLLLVCKSISIIPADEPDEADYNDIELRFDLGMIYDNPDRELEAMLAMPTKGGEA